jgi:hypothetical protein
VEALSDPVTKPGRGQTLLGCGFLLLVLYGIGRCGSTDPESASQTGQPSHIAAGIGGFRAALAQLTPGTMTQNAADGGIRYSWKFVSTSNSAFFFDDGADGTIDQVLASVCMPQADEDGLVLALGLAHTIVETAGGAAVNGPEFAEWIKLTLSKQEAHRRFGSVTVDINVIGARNGALLLLGIGGPPQCSCRPPRRTTPGLLSTRACFRSSGASTSRKPAQIGPAHTLPSVDRLFRIG